MIQRPDSFRRDEMGARETGTQFERTHEAALTGILLSPEAQFYFCLLHKNRILKLITGASNSIAQAIFALLDLRVPTQGVSSTDGLSSARAAIPTDTSADITEVEGAATAEEGINQFARTEMRANLQSDTPGVTQRRAEEARADLATHRAEIVETLSTLISEVNYLTTRAFPVAAIRTKLTAPLLARIERSLEARVNSLENGGLSSAQSELISLLSGSAALKAFRTARVPTEPLVRPANPNPNTATVPAGSDLVLRPAGDVEPPIVTATKAPYGFAAPGEEFKYTPRGLAERTVTLWGSGRHRLVSKKVTAPTYEYEDTVTPVLLLDMGYPTTRALDLPVAPNNTPASVATTIDAGFAPGGGAATEGGRLYVWGDAGGDAFSTMLSGKVDRQPKLMSTGAVAAMPLGAGFNNKTLEMIFTHPDEDNKVALPGHVAYYCGFTRKHQFTAAPYNTVQDLVDELNGNLDFTNGWGNVLVSPITADDPGTLVQALVDATGELALSVDATGILATLLVIVDPLVANNAAEVGGGDVIPFDEEQDYPVGQPTLIAPPAPTYPRRTVIDEGYDSYDASEESAIGFDSKQGTARYYGAEDVALAIADAESEAGADPPEVVAEEVTTPLIEGAKGRFRLVAAPPLPGHAALDATSGVGEPFSDFGVQLGDYVVPTDGSGRFVIGEITSATSLLVDMEGREVTFGAELTFDVVSSRLKLTATSTESNSVIVIGAGSANAALGLTEGTFSPMATGFDLYGRLEGERADSVRNLSLLGVDAGTEVSPAADTPYGTETAVVVAVAEDGKSAVIETAIGISQGYAELNSAGKVQYDMLVQAVGPVISQDELRYVNDISTTLQQLDEASRGQSPRALEDAVVGLAGALFYLDANPSDKAEVDAAMGRAGMQTTIGAGHLKGALVVYAPTFSESLIEFGEAMLSSLEERGYTRAADLLIQGRVSEFVGVTEGTASSSALALSSMQDSAASMRVMGSGEYGHEEQEGDGVSNFDPEAESDIAAFEEDD
jgi:hypothetical protein